VFSSVPEVSEGLRKAGYIAIFVASTIVFPAASLHPPVSSQGPAGSGQSQLHCQRFLQCWTASSRTAIRKSLVCLLIDELDKVDHSGRVWCISQRFAS
jgi:hypothetical protein